MPYRTDNFHALYLDVTKTLWLYILTAWRLGDCTTLERDWFLQLVVDFQVEFHAWPGKYPDIKAYLELFEPAPFQLRLAGHAFLHVAFDLPRIIADSTSFSLRERARLRTLFLRPAPLFRQVFMDRAKRGKLGHLARPLGYFAPAEVLGYWLTSLRSVAWIHAEVLADVSVRRRQQITVDLGKALLESGRIAMKPRWIGLLNIPKLDNNDLFQVVPSFSTAPVSLGLAAALGLGVTAAATVRARNELIARRVELLGERVYLETTKALRSDQGPDRELA
jgi:hypothetical protein